MQAPETLHLMIHKNLRSVSKLIQQIQGGNKKQFFFYNSGVVKQHKRQTTPMQIECKLEQIQIQMTVIRAEEIPAECHTRVAITDPPLC
jgi:hypothetical protein